MIVGISKRPEFIGKIIFLQNYNIQLAKKLYHGVDIWLNTPTRPLEASGTSGEKVVMNGGLHFSVLDGWWAEGYQENAGWALPLERTFENQELQDELDAEQLYALLENEITPGFYERNANDVPEKWIGYIKKSVTRVAPEFTMNRMMRDYFDRFYNKLFERSARLKKDDFKAVREISELKSIIIEQWKKIKVLEHTISDLEKSDLLVGNSYSGSVVLDINELSCENVGVEIIMVDGGSGKPNDEILEKLEMSCTGCDGSRATYTFQKQVGVTGQFDIGFRIYPKFEEMPHRMDLPLVHWI